MQILYNRSIWTSERLQETPVFRKPILLTVGTKSRAIDLSALLKPNLKNTPMDRYSNENEILS